MIRINKYLSDKGICSRREADRLIIDKKVRVNGKIVELGFLVSDDDIIEISGKEITKNNKKIYLKFYKPRGVTCTTAKFDKSNIISFLNYSERIYPVGRLDKDSEGLLLLTNDGKIVNPILKGSAYHEKEYIVTLNKNISDKDIITLRNGVPILGIVTRKCHIERISANTLKFIITQGLNRQIRRMCEYLGYNVIKLKRIRIINIKLDDLNIGQYRDLTVEELRSLKKRIGYYE